MPSFIRKSNTQLYLNIEIDSGGMSVTWTGMDYATPFHTPTEANSFIRKRLKERCPDEDCFVETTS